MDTYIGVELSDEAGEVVVLEVAREQIACEPRGTPNYKRGPAFVPRNHFVCVWIVHHLIRFR